MANEHKRRQLGGRGFSRPLSIGCGSKVQPARVVKKEKTAGFSSAIGTSLGERSFGGRTRVRSFFRAVQVAQFMAPDWLSPMRSIVAAGAPEGRLPETAPGSLEFPTDGA